MTNLPDAVAALLLDMELTEEERASINPFELLDLEYPNGPCPVWAEHGPVLVAHFVKRNPGRRPSRWWRYDAPRVPLGTYRWDEGLEQPRLRLGGTGTPAHEVFNVGIVHHCGIPSDWVTPEEVEIYSGRARDIHGELMNPEWAERPWPGVAIDPKDPPIYELQASYLRRHGLLLRGEERRLTPADYEPEVRHSGGAA